MAVSEANVPTASGGRYLQQLCKHWAHKMAVAFTAEEGTVNFPSGAVATMRAGTDRLHVRLSVPDAAELERMQQVLSSHLDRFAFREAPLTFDWRVVAEAPAT